MLLLLPMARLLAVLLCLAAAALPARAQQAAPTPAPELSTAELESLIETLENPEQRQQFVGQLKALVQARQQAAPEPAPIPDRLAGRFLGTLSEQLAEFGQTIFRAAAFVADAPNLFDWMRQQAESEWARVRLTEIFGKLAAVLFGAWLAEWLATRAIVPSRRRLATRRFAPGWTRAPFVLLQLFVELVPVVVFALAAFGILAMLDPSRTAGLVALALINANLIARAIRALDWTILSPQNATLRLVPLEDETAAYLHIWVRRLANVAVYGYFMAEAALLVGLPPVGHVFLLKLLGLAVALLLTILILQNRGAVARAIAGRAGGGAELDSLRRRLADLWHVAALLYVGMATVIWMLRPDGGFGFVARATALTVAIALLAMLAARLLRRLVGWLFRISADLRTVFPTLESRTNRYVQVITAVGTAMIYGFALLAILQAWGVGSLEWLATAPGRRVTGSIASILLTALVALGLWELVNGLLERYFTRPAANGVNGLRRAARARTLLPLLRRITFGFLAVFVGLVALSEIGINIAPLLAGAGIVGIAVGFGAQALMKDLFGGISIVLEDSMAVGDIVAIGDKGGVVEWMSLRVMRLRDFEGTVHTIPFGEVQTISNRTKDFAFAVFRIGVSYREDVARVQAVVRAVGAQLRSHPEFGPMILDDIELHGLDTFGDSAIVILARIKVMPAKQWTIMRNFNILLKEAFDREGIEIPFPQRVVHVVGDKTDGRAAAAIKGEAAGT